MQIPTDIISRALLVTATVLLVIVLFEAASIVGTSASDDSDSGAGPVALTDISPRAPIATKYPPVGSFAEIMRRPLFELSRRPVQIVAAENSTSAATLRKKWRLSGVILDDNNIAIIETVRPGENQSLVAGQSLDGWLVQEINADDVVLGRGTQSIRFTLHKEGATTAVDTRRRITQVWKPSEQ